MSSYIVEDKTINRVVSKLQHNRDLGGWIKRELAKLGYGESREDFERLGRAMFDLNITAVNNRYGDGEAEQFRPLNYQYRYDMTSNLQAYKSLKCWLYQCSEGDVPEQPLFKWFHDELRPTLAEEIINSLPQYEAATWG